nr:MAG: capsid protein [Cressdnaviricota sp.]
MPYKRRTPARATKRRPYKKKANTTMRKVARTEARKVVRQNHPIQFYDIDVNLTSTTSISSYNLLNTLLANGGILDSQPQANEQRYILASGSTINNTESRKVMITGIYFRLRFIASQATAVITSDLFNSIRHTMFYSDTPYSDSVTQILNDVDGFIDTRDIKRKHFDRMVTLGQNAFDTNSYSSPQQKTFIKFFKCRYTLDCFSDNAGTNWQNKKGTLEYQLVSDSAAAPHPTVAGGIRVYFRTLD